jgi:hypothetical protein
MEIVFIADGVVDTGLLESGSGMKHADMFRMFQNEKAER